MDASLDSLLELYYVCGLFSSSLRLLPDLIGWLYDRCVCTVYLGSQERDSPSIKMPSSSRSVFILLVTKHSTFIAPFRTTSPEHLHSPLRPTPNSPQHGKNRLPSSRPQRRGLLLPRRQVRSHQVPPQLARGGDPLRPDRHRPRVEDAYVTSTPFFPDYSSHDQTRK